MNSVVTGLANRYPKSGGIELSADPALDMMNLSSRFFFANLTDRMLK